MADKGGKKESTKVGKMKRGDSVKRTETPKKASETRGERKQRTSPRGVSVGRSKPKPTLNKQGAAGFAAGLDAAGKRKAAKKAETEAKAEAAASKVTSTTAKPEKKEEKKKRRFTSPASGRGRRIVRRMGGGMMKSKMASKGGAKGGRMPTGMKDGGSLEMTMVGGRKVPAFAADGKGANDLAKKMGGGMMKSKGMAKGGAMKKKGYAMGGSVKKKGMAKGGSVKKKAVSRKPRGVGAALRGYGKAMR